MRAQAVRKSRKTFADASDAGLEREVDAHVHAAVAEVAVGHPVEPVLAQQLVEVAQPGAQPLGRYGGVLPAGVRRGLQAARGQPGAVLADPPQRGRLGEVLDQPVPEGARGRGEPAGEVRGALGPGHLDEQPAGAGRQLGHRGSPGP